MPCATGRPRTRGAHGSTQLTREAGHVLPELPDPCSPTAAPGVAGVVGVLNQCCVPLYSLPRNPSQFTLRPEGTSVTQLSSDQLTDGLMDIARNRRADITDRPCPPSADAGIASLRTGSLGCTNASNPSPPAMIHCFFSTDRGATSAVVPDGPPLI